ncbi:MAG TPA: ABC transporter substrate-binding protein, partial [Spirochaetes bacterium]|nr:ABC transporter substrate-binding protein [Spirochaetota bacterium]
MTIVCSILIIACNKAGSQGSSGHSPSPSNTKVFKWKLAQTWKTNFPIFGDVTRKFVKIVNIMSNGRLIIKIVPSNIHKAPLGIFDFVKSGRYEMGHSASYYWKGKNFNAIFFTTVPFGMIATEQYAWFYYGGGMELMEEFYSKYGLLSFPGGNTGNQIGGWFRKEIKTIEDFKNLKMRIPGFAGEVLTKVGARTVLIDSGELYQSLERGLIDALEWVGPSLDLQMGFHKIAP